jgi:protoporphyrinogen oxidase
VLIAGAGLAGLSAAYHLRRAGFDDVVVIEAEDRPGGWAKTDWSGPWGADRAIHVLYFRDPEMQAWVGELLGDDWQEHRKNAIVDSVGIRTPYPFHANLYGRPPQVIRECLEGMWEASRAQACGSMPSTTFADWIELVHGRGVAKHFMTPYNTKQWTVPPSGMGWDWMGDFIPTVASERILEGALHPASAVIGLNASFRYARRGASQLADALASRVGPIRYLTRLARLEPCSHIAVCDDGTTISYDHLVSTIPLVTLGTLLAPLPAIEHAAWQRLECIDLVLVDVGFADPAPGDAHWAYLPDHEVLAYRVHAVHALSTAMMPEAHGLYCLEISHSRHRPLPDGDLRTRVVGDLVRTGWLASADQVTFYRERRFPCSYVLPRVGFQRDAAIVRD